MYLMLYLENLFNLSKPIDEVYFTDDYQVVRTYPIFQASVIVLYIEEKIERQKRVEFEN